MSKGYDLIVVGAGPGGTAAAKTAADKGLKVLLLERGRNPGDKNMSGSSLWRGISEEIFPGFSEAACNKDMPRFKGIAMQYVLDNDEKMYTLGLAPGADVFRNMLNVFRNETDKWFADQAVKAGAELKTALAQDLIWENKGTEHARVRGVVTDVGNFEAPVTIDASGLHSILARRAGLARFGMDKVMLAVKYVYRLDPEVLRQRVDLYWDTDGVEVYDWGDTPVQFGSTPEFFAAHAVAYPGRGIVDITTYQTLKEMVRARVNIHQRAQWYLNQTKVKRLIEGGEFIQCNFHCLTSFDTVGYVAKSYLPGLILVGDAGGFANPCDSWGANVAQWQGRMAAELAAEMKAKNDYSEAMFARYEKTWRESWVGEDEVHEISRFFRDGSFDKIWKALDEFSSFAIAGKFENMSYVSLFIGGLPKLLPALPAFLEMPMTIKKISEGAVKKAGGLMGLLSALKAE
ncbi:MAG: NAD(P)/FAD-dependent oxidoreductase [Clostridia bacterium]|nr:NAD(P)/FAD-dependent oxidoreductase [Clostridia bacterium]MDH7573034.1 NAD(P)/FAD-dependent oxidoreductase [Clostridia bacterium]